jgi:hypothetical protein
MRFIPWISIAIAIVAALSPLGGEVIHNLSSGEALSRSIAQLFVIFALPALLLLALIEIAIRVYLRRRRAAKS